jgi:hypothetical protein
MWIANPAIALPWKHVFKTESSLCRDVEQKLEEGISADSRGGLKNNTLLCEAACHGHHVSLSARPEPLTNPGYGHVETSVLWSCRNMRVIIRFAS